jgi:hypothetical protein
MSFQNSVVTECHLTPSGWVEGSEREFGTSKREVPTPQDRLLTVKRKVDRWSDHSKITFIETWRNIRARQEIVKLKELHPLEGYC